MQVENRLVSWWQLPDQISQVFGIQQNLRVVSGHRVKVRIIKRKFSLVWTVFLEIVNGGIDHNSPDPTAQFTLEPVLMQVPENFNKAFLQDILRISHGFGVPVTNRHHTAGKMVIQLALGNSFPF